MIEPKGLLFLPVEGATGRSVHFKKHHRHAQLKHLPNGDEQGVSNVQYAHSAPAPFQIRFRASERPDATDLYSGRCSQCKKRRKLAKATNRCRTCDRAEPSTTSSADVDHTTGLVVSGASQSTTWQPLPTVTRDISYFIDGGPGDRQAMHYFLSFAALDLSGWLPGRFWDGFVLQMSQAEPIVRQAVVATAGAHLDRCSDCSTSKMSIVSYQSAINKLRNYIQHTEEPSPVLVLMCCILLFTIDRMRGEYEVAAVHLNSAMAILNNAGKTPRPHKVQYISRRCEDNDINRLTTMLLQMDIEDTMPQLDRGPLLDRTWIDSVMGYFDQPLDLKFWAPQDYIAPWMRLCHATWAFIGRNAQYRHMPIEDVPEDVAEYRNGLQRSLKAWRVAFNEHIIRVGMPNCEDIPTSSHGREIDELDRQVVDAVNALIIESHYFVIKGILAECLGDVADSCPWDCFAEKLLHCGEKALSLRQGYQRLHSLSTPKTFSPHVGIAESLLCLSHRTTVPSVRSRAQCIIRGWREVSGDLSGVTAFFAGQGAPPEDMILMYEKPGH